MSDLNVSLTAPDDSSQDDSSPAHDTPSFDGIPEKSLLTQKAEKTVRLTNTSSIAELAGVLQGRHAVHNPPLSEVLDELKNAQEAVDGTMTSA